MGGAPRAVLGAEVTWQSGWAVSRPRPGPPHWLPLRSQPWRRCVAQIGSSEEVRISRRMSEPSFLLITTHKVGINILVFQLKKPRLSEVK